MKTRNSTKSKLLSSVIALVLCVSMLIGATFAWFTDAASTGVNKIQAGTLDVEVEYSTNGTSWATIEDATSLFSNNLWEPGHTEYVYLRVKNAGTLGLKYKVMVTPVSENGGINVNNQNFKLSDYLVFGTTDPSVTPVTYADRTAARNAVGTAMGLNQATLTKNGTIEAGDAEQYLALVVYMPETVGNEANAKPGTVAPSINLGITVVATQLEAEFDSFGQDYDAGAATTPEYVAGAYYDYFEAVNVSGTADGNGNFVVNKTNGSDIIASASGTASVGATVNMVITKTATPANNFGITVNNGEELNGYDIKVTGQDTGSLVQGKLYVGTGLENFVFYHNGVAMTKKTTGELANDEYRYNSNDGYVYFATTSFSPFQATYKAPVAAINTAVYGKVSDAFAAVKSGETITLLKDSVGNGIVVPSDSCFTVDFNSYTYDVNGELVGSSGTETNSLQLLKDSTITFKNGALTSAKAKILIQNYSNLTLENMSLTAGSQCGYVLSNNNGNVVIKDTTINAAKGKVAFDVCRYDSYVGPEVTVEGNSVINGNVEISSSGAKEGATHKLNVTGGTFNGKIYKYGNSPDFVGNITGGKFVADKISTLNNLITWTAENASNVTITLLKDLNAHTYSNLSYLNKNITLDLNGKTITMGDGTFIAVKEGRNITIKNGALDIASYGMILYDGNNNVKLENVRINSGYIGVWSNSANNTVDIKDCDITSAYVGVYQNGSNGGNTFNIANTTITDTVGVGVYISNSVNNAKQTLTIDNCVISGPTAVEVKHTNATIKSSTLTATAEEKASKVNGNGPCTTGYTLAVTSNNATDNVTGTVTVDDSVDRASCFVFTVADGASVTINREAVSNFNNYGEKATAE